MRVYGMQVNHIARPLGFDLTPLRFSYKVACEGGKRQQSARVRVYGPDESVVYDSGTRQDIDSLCFAPDIPLSPRTRYTWDVAVTADTGETALSPRAWFETAKLQEPWLGQWIAAPRQIANARLVKRFAHDDPSARYRFAARSRACAAAFRRPPRPDRPGTACARPRWSCAARRRNCWRHCG